MWTIVKIPEPFQWDESFAVLIGELDEEHKHLFQALYDISQNPDKQSVVRSCYNIYKNHFSNEEGYMTRCKYNLYPDHKRRHEEFLRQLNCYCAPISKETLHYAKDWLVHHIKNVDFLYKGKL